jgi:UDP-N-acetylglucosamine 2-epimerase
VRVLSVVGARPQFIKAAVVSQAFRVRGIEEMLVHTGQHYDARMSDVFFSELALPAPHRHLGVGSGSHGAQTGEMMMRLDPVIEAAQPDCVLVYGDTNSTLAGALCGVKFGIPVVHVEAGLRSFNRAMPEEINRLVADRVSDVLLAPTERAAQQLRDEGVTEPIEVVGDVMVDLALEVAAALPARPAVLERFSLSSKRFGLATIHRASNTADTPTFARLIAGLRALPFPVLFPVHPRTQPLCDVLRVGAGDNILTCEPLPYRDMLALQVHARVVLTDSGGVQKEAVTVGTPCVTMREETEWAETLEGPWNVLAGSDAARIAEAAQRPAPATRIFPYGRGESAKRIVDAILAHVRVAEQAASCAS